MAFATLGIVQLFLAWSLRSNLPLWRTGLMGNKWMWYAFFASLSLQLAVMLIDPIQNIFSLTYLTGEQWLWVIGLSLVPSIIQEISKEIRFQRES